MNSKRCKKLRKLVNYNIQEERKEPKKYFLKVPKDQIIEEGKVPEKHNGMICQSETRRAYQYIKKHNVL